MRKPRLVIFGARGLAGKAILEALYPSYSSNWEIIAPTSHEVDLHDWHSTKDFLMSKRPELLINAAARVGGISFNEKNQINQALYNSRISLNLLEASDAVQIPNLISISSSCVYPSNAIRPYKEEDLYSGKGESTNEGYSIAKMLAIRFIEMKFNHDKKNWVNLIATNLFGINDKYNVNGHLVGSAIQRLRLGIVNNQKELVFRGTGNAIREFMFSKDLGDSVKFLIENEVAYPTFNVTNGESKTVKQILQLLCGILNFPGEVFFTGDITQDGNPDKRLDSSRLMNMGWRPKYSFEIGLRELIKNTSV